MLKEPCNLHFGFVTSVDQIHRKQLVFEPAGLLSWHRKELSVISSVEFEISGALVK